MVLLANALISTARSTSSGGNTTPAQPYLVGEKVRIQPNVQSAYKTLPTSALESDYHIFADSGSDVVEGDIVTAITKLDGVTPWPGPGAINDNEYFRVVYTHESSSGPVQHRNVYVARIRGGGIVY